MKTYEPRRNNECPNGIHATYNPDVDPSQNECTCPWLIIQSSSPVQHLTSWNRRELDNAIREFDNGYFDPPGYPRRERSMFLSAPMQRLLDVAQAQPVAAALTLLAGSGSGLPPFDAIAWDAEDAVLSLRVGGGGWWHLFLGKSNVEAVTNHDDAHAAGAAPVLLWAEHPDTAEEIGLPVIGPFSVRFPVPTADYFAEDISRKACEEAEQIRSYEVAAIMAQDADDVAADSATARVMGDHMPLFLTVPADEIENLRAGNPIFDEAMRKSEEGGHAGFLAIPEEMTFPEGADPTIVANIEAFIEAFLADPSTGVRRERPLPRRVPQVPSDIAEAGQAVYCTCDLNLRYTCPACRAAQADACICDIRGSASDTYACPEHPADARCAVPVRVLYPGDDINISTAYCEKAANHGDVHAGGGFAWSYDELEITAPQPR